MIGAKRKDSCTWSLGIFSLKPVDISVYCMQDACRIVHYTIRIDHGTKLIGHETLTNIVGKTRTYKQHTLARFNAEPCERYIYRCAKLHNRLFI